MAAAFVSNAGGVNLVSSVSTLTTPFVAASGFNVVHIGIRSKLATVLSVTDDAGTPNTYTKKASITARTEVDYTNEYNIPPVGAIFHGSVEAESWTATVSSACKNVIVTLTSGAKFAVQCNNYTSGTGFGASSASTASLSSTSAPTISLTPAASTSIISAGFVTAAFLAEVATLGTIRGSQQAETTQSGISVITADHTGTTPLVVTLGSTDTETVDGVTFAFPAAYAVTSVEIKA